MQISSKCTDYELFSVIVHRGGAYGGHLSTEAGLTEVTITLLSRILIIWATGVHLYVSELEYITYVTWYFCWPILVAYCTLI